MIFSTTMSGDVSENLMVDEYGIVASKSYFLPPFVVSSSVMITDPLTFVPSRPMASVIDLDDVLKYVLEQKRTGKAWPRVTVSGT